MNPYFLLGWAGSLGLLSLATQFDTTLSMIWQGLVFLLGPV